MESKEFLIESNVPFEQSAIWNYNNEFYQSKGIEAWSEGIVPHNVTSNSLVAQTYAKLIFGFLNDIALRTESNQVVYILELGAGHGRLCFHVLQHLKKLITNSTRTTPPFCYVLTDYVEDNLTYYKNHPQFQTFFESGELDFAHFDATKKTEIHLLNSDIILKTNSVQHPIFVIANYFFDSLPNELFHIHNNEISKCSVSIKSSVDPLSVPIQELLKYIDLSYKKTKSKPPFTQDRIHNKILQEYLNINEDTFIFFPKIALHCLSNIKQLSKGGLVLLTMDKGYHRLPDLINDKEPDLVKHGSFSLLVNFHALKQFCLHLKGKVLFPTFSNFSIELGCLIFTDEVNNFIELEGAYDEYVEKFSPDDYNIIKEMCYSNVSNLKIKDLIAIYRLSKYDASVFINLLPKLKHSLNVISLKERERLAHVIDLVWLMYFNINEQVDLSYELGIILYDLAYYSNAANYFQHSISQNGMQADVIYNQALCYYQLRQDEQFYFTLNKAKAMFPDTEIFTSLEKLDMT
ncbi:MAG: SAM-dependent methyltransferase [Bacteroidia bacterium]|nr:SAM-dependent methyltransferase [Bacteroidia bacterium]